MIDCTEKIKSLVKKNIEEVVSIRRYLHEYPETGGNEINTAKIIREKLEQLGIETKYNIAKTGVVGIIRGNHPGKTLMIRADMDALSLNEETDLPYKSKNEGVMHACAHDGHVASLLGAAMVLSEMKDHLQGNVKLLFQPSEEDYIDGELAANIMIREGVLEDPKVDFSMAQHLWGTTEEGIVEIKTGGIMAAPDKFTFKIIGNGGAHGSMPHLCVDPVATLAQTVVNIYTGMQRIMNPADPAIISICKIKGGEEYNILPNEAEASGTIRTFSGEMQLKMKERLESIIAATAQANGATYELEYYMDNPPVMNDATMVNIIKASAAKIVGSERVQEPKHLVFGGEDYACFAREVPSALFFVGIAKDLDNPPIHHNEKFQWDDGVLSISVNVLCQAALDILEQSSK